MAIDSFPVIGIALAVLSAALLTVGNLLQSRGVATRRVGAAGALGQATSLQLTLGCVLGIAVAGALSIVFVHTAHTVNNPQTVVAGLTVVDPFIAVVLGLTVLQEAAGAPLWSFVVFAVAGLTAIAGVWMLAQAQQDPEVDSSSAGRVPGVV